jgi:hypothetical protein
MNVWCLLILLLATPSAAFAAPGAEARVEIIGLMDALAKSECQFQRNGSWYDGSQARAHLQRKYDYLLKKGVVDTSEQFIQRAASHSSLSGRGLPRQMRGPRPGCGQLVWRTIAAPSWQGHAVALTR